MASGQAVYRSHAYSQFPLFTLWLSVAGGGGEQSIAIVRWGQGWAGQQAGPGGRSGGQWRVTEVR